MPIRKSISKRQAKKLLKNEGYKNISLSGGMSVGHVSDISLEKVKRSWSTLPMRKQEPFHSCYAGYITSDRKIVDMKQKWKYYAAFPSVPVWFPEFVEDFNSFFDNIKIEVLDTRTSFINLQLVETPMWGSKTGEVMQNLGYKFNTTKGDIEVSMPLIRFDYAEEYDIKVQYFFNYIVVIFVRMLNLVERFTNPFYYPKGDKIKYLVGVNNRNKGYRTLSEKIITLKDLKKLDDIELMNNNVDSVYRKWSGQTRIFSYLIKDKQKERKTIIAKKVVVKRPLASRTVRQKSAEIIEYLPSCQCQYCQRYRVKNKLKFREEI